MCEQLFKYDCGHLYRRILRCNKQREQHLPSKPFSAQSISSEIHCHGTKKLERRGTLCPKCEMLEKDGEVYVNATKRVSLPIAQAKTNLQQHRENDDSTNTRVSTDTTGFRRTKSNPALLPSQHLRRVEGMDSGSLRNEYTRLETRPDNIFQAQGDKNTGKGSQCAKEIRLELSRDRGDEAGLVQHAGECIPSEKLVRNGNFKAPSHNEIDRLSFNSEHSRPEPLQDHDSKLSHDQNTGGSVQRDMRISPKIQDTGGFTLPNRRIPTRLSQDNGLGAHRGKKLRFRDLIMPILEVDWYTSTYITCMMYSPSNGTSFAEVLNHDRSECEEPRTPAPEIARPEKKPRKRLQKMRSLYHHLDSSDESFVCSRAREVENSGQ
ncbi:hypothetical protein ACQKWADRAFT_326639 [Trichoderma austrokoningii]